MIQLMPLHPKTPLPLASFTSRLVLLFWYWLTQVVLEKRPLNGRSSSSILIIIWCVQIVCSVLSLACRAYSRERKVASRRFLFFAAAQTDKRRQVEPKIVPTPLLQIHLETSACQVDWSAPPQQQHSHSDSLETSYRSRSFESDAMVHADLCAIDDDLAPVIVMGNGGWWWC